MRSATYISALLRGSAQQSAGKADIVEAKKRYKSKKGGNGLIIRTLQMSVEPGPVRL